MGRTRPRNSYRCRQGLLCEWPATYRRAAHNPLKHFAPRPHRRRGQARPRGDGRPPVARLIAAAQASGRTFRGLSGPDCCPASFAACGTGFRASVLASLTPEDFDLAGEVPTVMLAVARNKLRRGKVQPLAGDVAARPAYLGGKPACVPRWGPWASDRKAADMLRIDLAAAGIPYRTEGCVTGLVSVYSTPSDIHI